MGRPPTDPALWTGDETADFAWDCSNCAGRLEMDVRPVDVGPEGAVNVLEAWCEVCDIRWFPPWELRLQEGET